MTVATGERLCRSCEGLVAAQALLLLFTFVRFQVSSQVTGQGEPLLAVLADVRLVSCMQEEMVLEIGLLAEAPVANMTLKWPGAAVNVHVALEVTGRWERFGAQRALVRLLLGVRHAMIVEI